MFIQRGLKHFCTSSILGESYLKFQNLEPTLLCNHINPVTSLQSSMLRFE